MRTYSFIFIVFFSFQAIGQSKYSELDSLIRSKNIRTKNVRILHERLVSGLHSDKDKMRAFFIWITANIKYDIKISNDKKLNARFQQQTSTYRIKNILKKRYAICEGYSELFYELCNLSGINSRVVRGYSKTNRGEINKETKPNHAWNEVFLDGEWKPIDVTWGRSANDGTNIYFLTPVKSFYLSHFPYSKENDMQYIPYSLEEFFGFPVIHSGLYLWVDSLTKDSLAGFRILSLQETMEITFESEEYIGIIDIINNGREMKISRFEKEGNKCKVHFKFPKTGNYYPTLYVNGSPVVTYKVKVVDK